MLVSGLIEFKTVVDPSSHRTNPPVVFSRPEFEWVTEAAERDVEALDAVRKVHQAVWRRAESGFLGCSRHDPCEKTIRNRFGSFLKATEAAAGRDKCCSPGGC